jgi:hypothetical protein
MGPRTFAAIYSHEMEGGGSGMYVPEDGGVLVIESATVDRVQGRVEFRAEGTNTYNVWAVQGHVRLRAAFTAVPADGDPYELSRLPGELRALADVEGAGPMDAALELDEAGSLGCFMAGVVEHLVLGVSLPHILEVFAAFGLEGPAVRRAEALLFAALPFDALLEVGHFGAEASAAKAEFRRAVAEQAAVLAGVPAGAMAPLSAARLDEYADVVFEEGQFFVREEGMADLARRAYTHVVGGELHDHALGIALFTCFSSVSDSLGYGERLAELHDLYDIHGDDIWEGDDVL